MNKEIDNRMKALRNKGGYYAQAVEEEYPVMKERLAAKAQDIVVSRALSQAQESAEKLIAAESTDILQNPQNWRAAADRIEANLQDAFIAPDKKAALIKDARNKIAAGAAAQLAGVDPNGTYKLLQETDVFARDLSLSERQRIMRQIATQNGKVETNPVIYADLNERAERGENIAVDLRNAYLFQKISQDDYDRLSALARTVAKEAATQNRNYLMGNLKSAIWFKTPMQEMAELDAKSEAEEWFRNNKGASLFELDDKIRELRYKYSLFQDLTNLTLPEKKRKELIKRYYTANDGSDWKNPTYEGFRTTTAILMMRSDKSLDEINEIAAAIDIEKEILNAKGTVKK